MVGEVLAIPGVARPSTESTGHFTVKLPRLSDPRLHVAAVLLSVQVLGQASLDFDLSIAQILVALGTAGAIELVITARRTRVIAWPASALLTGNGVALILRVPGTEHGEWFSMRGWYVFAATAALALLSKYVICSGDRPLFNPSNFGLVATFLILGSGIADPQDLWWGPMSAGLALTYLVILVGGVVITRRLGLLAVSGVFWSVFAVIMGLLAVTGHSMTARWNIGPVGGMQYWTTLALSPEILIFLFFMITDPRTAARGRSASLIYAALVGVASGVLVAFQSTEYATKVALLGGLVLVCAFRPLIERMAPATDDDSLARWATRGRRRPAALMASGAGVVALVLVGSVTASPVTPVASVGDRVRPELELEADQQPEVELGDVEGVGGSLDAAAAERFTADVVEGVILADRAVQEGDHDLAAAVAIPPYLDELDERPAEPAPDRTFSDAVVDVVRDPENFQAVPRVAVTLSGTEDGEPWSETYHVAPSADGALIEREVEVP